MTVRYNGEPVELADGPAVRDATAGIWEVDGEATAEYRLTELDQADPAGRYRLQVSGDVLRIQRAASAAWATATTLLSLGSDGGLEMSTPTYASLGSFQALAGDLNLGAAAGTSGASDTDFLAAVMGNLISTANLSRTNNYLAGVIGMYSLSGTQASVLPKGAVLGIIAGDPVAVGEDGAFVAVCDGDSGQLVVEAAYTVFTVNSTAGSGFNFGLDLFRAAVGSFLAADILVADIRLHDQQVIMSQSSVLAADTEVTSVIIGTSDHQGLAASSVAISNVIADGDIAFYVNNGGNSLEALLIDASALDIYLGFGGFDVRLIDDVALILGTGADWDISFDGTDLLIISGVATADVMLGRTGAPSPDSLLHLWESSAGTVNSITGALLTLERAGDIYINLLFDSGRDAGLVIGQGTNNNRAHITYTPDTWEISINSAARLQYSTGAFAFQEATTISTTAGDLTLSPAGIIGIPDDIRLALGDGGDIAALNRSTALAADTELTNVIVGTSDHQGVTANSLIISNVTASGDIALYVNNNGNSIEALLIKPSTKVIHLGFGFSDVSFSASNSNGSTTLTVENTVNSGASHAVVDIAVGGTTSTGDPQLRLTIPSGTSYYIGVDNSGTDQLFIGTGTTVGTASIVRLDSAGVQVTGDINPEADGTRDLGTQTTAQWANLWADAVNGADFGMANKWRMLESELYAGYGKGWALGHDARWQDGRSLWVNPADVTPDQHPVFAVTDDFIEYKGRRITPDLLDRLLEGVN